ncbi:MAG: hypothetical protein IPM77_08130 [Crocinitomicaceae bacterium]|nr:hypothetical protein [Crocinitomicaceae bacterium]
MKKSDPTYSFNLKSIVISFFLTFISSMIIAQDNEAEEWEDEEEKEIHGFYDTRVINGHSSETLEKGTFDLRITHRFGNIAEPSSGRTLFGLDNSTDIRIAFEYAPTDQLLLGFGRCKGFVPYTEYWDGFAKYKIFNQGKKFPVTLTAVGSTFATSMASSNDSTLITNFTNPARRFTYYTQLIVARNLYDKITLQLAPGILHRNFVNFDDENTNFVLGGMIRYNFYKKLSILAEYYHLFRNDDLGASDRYKQSLGFALEIKTFAHVFQLSFTNSEAIGEGQFIPYTASNWLDGQFRFGFTISREF